MCIWYKAGGKIQQEKELATLPHNLIAQYGNFAARCSQGLYPLQTQLYSNFYLSQSPGGCLSASGPAAPFVNVVSLPAPPPPPPPPPPLPPPPLLPVAAALKVVFFLIFTAL